MRRFVLIFALGCGGGDVPPPKAPSPAPAELQSVVFALPKANDDQMARVRTAFEGALIHAGYKLSDGTTTYDLVLKPQVSYTVEPTFLHTYVNGREKQKLRYRVTLAVLAKDTILDQQTTEFVVDSEDPISENWLTPLVDGIGRSERVKRAVLDLAQHASEGDEKEWIAAKVEACRQPIKLDACDKLRLFLANHANGAHADEAKHALEEAQPMLEKLQKDENAWQRADVDECRAKKDCTAVELYLKLFPAGMHAKEGRQLVGK